MSEDADSSRPAFYPAGELASLIAVCQHLKAEFAMRVCSSLLETELKPERPDDACLVNDDERWRGRDIALCEMPLRSLRGHIRLEIHIPHAALLVPETILRDGGRCDAG